MNVQTLENPLANPVSGMLTEGQPLAQGLLGGANGLLGGTGAPMDAIARMTQPAGTDFEQAPGVDGGQSTGPLGGMLGQIMQMLQSLMSALGLGGLMGGSGFGGTGFGGTGFGGFPGAGGIASGNEQFYGNASGASQGDPHLSFNGNTWDNMSSQPDLLESNSIPGGFQIGTQVTPANNNGVTYNQSATVSLNGGATTVSMNNAGQATVQEYGQTLSLSPGQSLQLGNGASVQCNANGSLSIQAQNGYGGEISTTLTAQGPGVNVAVNAQNVDLGGSLASGHQMVPLAQPATGGVPLAPPANGIGLPFPQPPLPAPWATPNRFDEQP